MTTKKIQSRGRTPKVIRTDNPTAATAGDDAPRTAYQLLGRVARHIVDEPLRYVQSTWMVRGKRNIKALYGVEPPCGTIACRAGWIVALHDGVPQASALSKVSMHTSMFPMADRANEILDVDTEDTRALFDGYCLGGASRGTKAYARAGAAGIREFMRNHAAHLKSRLLKDVPKLGGHRG